MNRDSSEDRLVLLRDDLLDELDEAGVRGVVSAGLGRFGGRPALVLLVNSLFRGGAPTVFRGTPVIIHRTDSAVA